LDPSSPRDRVLEWMRPRELVWNGRLRNRVLLSGRLHNWLRLAAGRPRVTPA